MNVERIPFLGGVEYVCSNCGEINEVFYYPTSETEISAQKMLEINPKLAKEMGIDRILFQPCFCC